MSLTPISPVPFSDSTLKIPSTNYRHTVRIGTNPEKSPPNNTEVKEATIEINIQGWYKFFVEPLKGHPPVSMEKSFIASPKFSYKFNIPLVFLTNTPFAASYVSQELAKLPISSDLAMYLKPHIVQNAKVVQNALAKKSQTYKEFKIVFDVKVVKIDLADNQECDGYRRRGLV